MDDLQMAILGHTLSQKNAMYFPKSQLLVYKKFYIHYPHFPAYLIEILYLVAMFKLNEKKING